MVYTALAYNFKMASRGPYKLKYELNTGIAAVPKSNLHDRRKRRLVEVNIRDSVENDRDLEFNTTHLSAVNNEQIYLDDHDLQVRH